MKMVSARPMLGSEAEKVAFEDFLSACGNFIQSDAPSSTIKNINSKASIAILYCSEANAKLVKELVETVIASRNNHVTNDELNDFSKCLLFYLLNSIRNYKKLFHIVPNT